MPMNRYEIRDEYSLADPELYRAADKDDPEALLEGVAMAGLVGVLRQLGDLSEFAAEIFHDLHEEVMVTAARGNSLMIRVQQLETDVHSVEKAFLSQTDHSSFFYNAGIDWKANQRVDQNLVAQGNLPRFVMDSYEECRGPPRLFLLDKFDVAGAGACLKRYTDPSFFKLETSATANADVPREKKMKKAKKKGLQGRYGEKTELLQPPSHAKLHHLLLEEPVENGTSKPAYRPKLKRRPNRFPFDSLSGKSYMEQLLKSPSPGHKMLHFDDQNESVLELRSVSPARETEVGKSNPPYSDKEETLLNPSMNDIIDASSDIRTYGVPDVITSISNEESEGKDIAIVERSLIGYQSDDVASEIDNYVDAPSTMQPEVDSDSELRVKNDLTLHTENQSLVSAKSLEHCHSLSLDSQSTGDFSISDEGNNSYKKEMSSFLSSDSPRTSAENLQSEKLSADELLIVNASSFERSPDHFDEVSKSVVSNFVQPTSSLSRTSSVPTSPQYDLRKGGSRGAKSDETISNSDDEENKRDLILNSPGDDSLRSGEHQMDGEIRWVSRTADIIHHTSDRLDAISASSRHEDDCDQTDLNQFENRIGSEKVVSKERPTPRELDNGVAKLAHNSAIDCSDLAHYGGHVASKVSEAYDEYKLYTEYPNVVSETVNSEAHWSNEEVVSKESLFYVPENNGDSSELSCNAENDGVNPDGGISGLQLTEISSPLNMKLSSQLHVSLDEFNQIRDESETARIACSIPAVSDNTIRENVISPAGLDELVEEHVSIGTASLSGFIREPEVVEEREAAMLDFDAVFKTEHDDHHNQEVLHTDFSSYLDSEVKHKVDMVSAAKIEPPLEPSGLDKEEESKQLSSVENQVDSLHVNGVAKESTSPESIELPPDSTDDELPKSSRILQLLDHDDGKEVENLASSFPPVNNPFSVSVYPNDSLGFIFPQGDVFPVTDQISVDQLHPLPPLPPLQWRTGKLQHASSTSELEKVEIKELLPQETFPPATSIEDVSSSPEQIKESPIQSPQITFEQGTPSLKANSLHATIDLSQEVENEQPHIFTPMKKTEIPSPAEEVGVAEGSRPVPHITLKEENAEHCSPTLEVDPLNQSVDPPAKVKEGEVPSPAEDVGVAEESKKVELPIQIAPHFTLKEEIKIVELPTLEADRMNHTADPPPKEEQQQQQQQQQQQLLLATQQSEIPSPAVEDEVSRQSRKMKLPKTCNPVIGSVAALDKSRLRKVTERATAQIGKPDERDALLDQIRAKSFNLKPTAVSRPTSIQAPNTNLRVAAILEKANAIRQAFAGSDEDDEDNWSDS